MTWLQQLQHASFRGVHFHVDTIEHTAGDNVVMREYPFQDLPTVFRMGEAAEEIKFSAYVIGPDYMQRRDALRQVLSGQGELVHPTAGTLLVFVHGKYKISENPSAQGGMARFELAFVRAQERRYPVGVADSATQAYQAAGVVRVAARSAFASSFGASGQTGWVGDRAALNFKAAMQAAWAALRGPGAGLAAGAAGSAGGVANAIAAASTVAGAAASINADYSNNLTSDYQVLANNIDTLLTQPALLADRVDALFVLPTEMTAGQAQGFQTAHHSLFNLASKLPQTDFEVRVMPPVGAGLVLYGAGKASALVADTPQRQALAVQNAASLQLWETLATAAYVQACARYELQGYEEAMALRQAVNTQCTRLLLLSSRAAAPERLALASWHDAVVAMHSAALGDLIGRSRKLTRLASYTPTDCVPVWVISYRLFGTARYADELLAMNPHITHPLLVPAGRPLRVPAVT